MARMVFVTQRAAATAGTPRRAAPWLRDLVVALTAFLTLVDLFATQAILPSLARRFDVGAAAMGTAVNACTIGMAIAGLAVALVSRRIDRRRGISICLALLAIPTALLAAAPDLPSFAALRIAQGLLMSAAFTLTLAHLGEQYDGADAASAFAAYITGNVASNLFGRALSAALADALGVSETFVVFAALNLAGAVLAYVTLARTPPMPSTMIPGAAAMRAGWTAHLRDPQLRAAFAIGFCILFAFIGTFTYVTFALVRAPFALAPMTLALVPLVFLPSILTTPLAGRAAARFGTRATLLASLGLAVAALPLLVLGSLPMLLLGLTLVAAGTFLAQATATGHVGRTATGDRGAASGLYLASYFGGGLAGSATLGIVFERFGWEACVAGIGAALVVAMALALRLRSPGTRL